MKKLPTSVTEAVTSVTEVDTSVAEVITSVTEVGTSVTEVVKRWNFSHWSWSFFIFLKIVYIILSLFVPKNLFL